MESRESVHATAGPRITYLQPRRVDRHIATQRYFLMALAEVAQVRIANQSLISRPFRRPEAKVQAVFRGTMLSTRSPVRSLRPIPETGPTGRYVAEIDGREIRFAIDCADSGEIREIEAPLLDWADVYFKANWRPTYSYDPKVVPIINSNGFFTQRRIALLRRSRPLPKDIDVSFVSNVWGGREHNVRLFEQLARVNANTKLQAIFTPMFDPEETAAFKERLRAAGVPTSEHHVPLRELTRILARSKIVFFRSGKHLCLPWRTLDLLALGSCIVFDSPPVAQWYTPLRAGTNYIDCGIKRPLDTSAAPEHDYEQIKPTVEALLSNPGQMAEIRGANARYFDEHAAPRPVGEYILNCLTRVRAEPAITA